MRFQILIQSTIVFGLLMSGWMSQAGVANDDPNVLADFAKSVQANDELDSATKAEVKKLIVEYGADSVADAITESLIVINDGYGDAIEASDGDDVAQATSALQPFAESDDPFTAADASFYLARMLMNNEQYEMALPYLKKVRSDLSDYSAHAGNAQFYTAVAQAGLLEYSKAVETFKEFLALYPDSPERLRVAAWRQSQQLRDIKDGQMADIYQRMDYSRRKLSLIDPGDETQTEQRKIVNMLGKLIKEQEKKEASNQNQNQKNTKQQQQQKPQQQQQQQQSSQSQQSSKSQKGGKSNNPNGQALRKAYNDAPTSPWSRLRDRSRDPANNAIKDKFPARYRDIVERYYEAANGNGAKK